MEGEPLISNDICSPMSPKWDEKDFDNEYMSLVLCVLPINVKLKEQQDENGMKGFFLPTNGLKSLTIEDSNDDLVMEDLGYFFL